MPEGLGRQEEMNAVIFSSQSTSMDSKWYFGRL